MKNILSLSFLLFVGQTLSQQESIFTQFWNTKQQFNPAFTGLELRHEAHAIGRWQWNGVNAAPDNQLLSYAAKINKWNSGLGLTYLHEKIGFIELNQVKANYSYNLIFNENHSLSFGVSGGFNLLKIEAYWIPPTTSNDPMLPQNETSFGFTPDLGIAYKFKRLKTGFSVTQLVDSRSTSNYTEARHYYLFANYSFGNEEKFQILPQVLLRTDLVKLSADINALMSYQNKYWLGLTWRTSDAICFTAGYTLLKKFNLSYSYDLTINKLSSISTGSHEIHLGFTLR